MGSETVVSGQNETTHHQLSSFGVGGALERAVANAPVVVNEDPVQRLDYLRDRLTVKLLGEGEYRVHPEDGRGSKSITIQALIANPSDPQDFTYVSVLQITASGGVGTPVRFEAQPIVVEGIVHANGRHPVVTDILELLDKEGIQQKAGMLPAPKHQLFTAPDSLTLGLSKVAARIPGPLGDRARDFALRELKEFCAADGGRSAAAFLQFDKSQARYIAGLDPNNQAEACVLIHLALNDGPHKTIARQIIFQGSSPNSEIHTMQCVKFGLGHFDSSTRFHASQAVAGYFLQNFENPIKFLSTHLDGCSDYFFRSAFETVSSVTRVKSEPIEVNDRIEQNFSTGRLVGLLANRPLLESQLSTNDKRRVALTSSCMKITEVDFWEGYFAGMQEARSISHGKRFDNSEARQMAVTAMLASDCSIDSAAKLLSPNAEEAIQYISLITLGKPTDRSVALQAELWKAVPGFPNLDESNMKRLNVEICKHFDRTELEALLRNHFERGIEDTPVTTSALGLTAVPITIDVLNQESKAGRVERFQLSYRRLQGALNAVSTICATNVEIHDATVDELLTAVKPAINCLERSHEYGDFTRALGFLACRSTEAAKMIAERINSAPPNITPIGYLSGINGDAANQIALHINSAMRRYDLGSNLFPIAETAMKDLFKSANTADISLISGLTFRTLQYINDMKSMPYITPEDIIGTVEALHSRIKWPHDPGEKDAYDQQTALIILSIARDAMSRAGWDRDVRRFDALPNMRNILQVAEQCREGRPSGRPVNV